MTAVLNVLRKYWAWGVFIILAAILVAGVLGYLDPVQSVLDSEAATFRVGDFTVSAYDAVSALLILIVIVWIAAVTATLAEKQIKGLKVARVSTRNLIAQITRIVIYVIAFLIGLDAVGLDLTALTVFSGALGIGIGFGLQKIASNFISGLILLAEQSIEDGDLVEMPDGTAGFVRKSGARYMLLETFDGKEILVPNEDLITGRVINWTLSNNRGRVEIDVGVSYGTDLKHAQALMLEAARNHPACINDPEPLCFLTTFGDSAIEFQLLFWVEDVTAGRRAPQSEVMFAIVDAFKAAGITIPFPQRDVHMFASAAPETSKAHAP
jgi:small-conductance mechanosensitive channel